MIFHSLRGETEKSGSNQTAKQANWKYVDVETRNFEWKKACSTRLDSGWSHGVDGNGGIGIATRRRRSEEKSAKTQNDMFSPLPSSSSGWQDVRRPGWHTTCLISHLALVLVCLLIILITEHVWEVWPKIVFRSTECLIFIYFFFEHNISHLTFVVVAPEDATTNTRR